MNPTCDRCGEVNPADIHTCTPKADPYASEAEVKDLLSKGKLPEALRLAALLETHPEYTPLFGKAADELRRLHAIEQAYGITEGGTA